MNLLKNYHTKRILVSATVGLLVLLSSCSNNTRKTVVIWTNRTEFVAYSEVFNTVQDKIKALVIYKENPADSLPAAKDETQPDIIVGNFLRTEKKRKQFRSLNYLFTTGEINESIFYNNLISGCKKNDSVYQVPVSFNIPSVIFLTENQSLVSENYMLSPDQIQSLAAAYNEKNKNNMYTRMGFAPQWYPDFLYTMARLNGVTFSESGTSFSWNDSALNQTIYKLNKWTKTANSTAQDELDFAFKYLYTPPFKQVTSGHCLFAFLTSDQLFQLSQEQLEIVDFRWIHQNNKIPIDDSLVTMGLYNRAPHKSNAEVFLSWFFTENAQKEMMKHVHDMNLNTETFGIAGGFSAIKTVNERVFPIYYLSLLANLPISEYLETPPVLPLRWESMKDRIILPYIADSINSPEGTSVRSIKDRISDWHKQYF